MGEAAVKQVTLNVDANNNTAGGLAEVKTSVGRVLREIDAEAQKTMAASQRAVAEFKKQKAQQDKGGAIGSLKESFGEESGLGQGLKALKGAGAVAGLTLISEGARNLGQTIKSSMAEFQAGKVSAAELTDQFARQLPIVGGIVSLGRDLKESWDGTAAATAKATEEANFNRQAVEKLQAAHKTVLDLTKEYAAINDSPTQSINRKAAEDLQKIEDARKALRATGKKAGGEDDRKLDEDARQIRVKQWNDLDKVGSEEFDKAMGKRHAQTSALLQSSSAIEQAHVSTVVNALRDAGKEVDARLAELDASTKAKLDNIAQRRTAIQDDGQLTNGEKTARSAALGDETRSVYDSDAVERARIKKQGGDQSRQTQLSADVALNQIQIDQLTTLAALGDTRAGIEAKRLTIHQKYVDQAHQLDELLKKQDLTADERAQAESARASISKRETADVTAMLREQADARAAAAVNVDTGTDISVYASRAQDALAAIDKTAADQLTSPPTYTPLPSASSATAQQVVDTLAQRFPDTFAVSGGSAKPDATIQKLDAIRDLLAQLVTKLSGQNVRVVNLTQ